MQQHITDYSARLASALTLPAIKEVPQLAAAFKSAWDNKKTIYLCGNGGSAADAQHLAAELSGKFYKDRKAFSQSKCLPFFLIPQLLQLVSEFSKDLFDKYLIDFLIGFCRPSRHMRGKKHILSC